MAKHVLISSKLKKTVPLLQDRILHRYVPEFHILTKRNLKRMLFTYSTIYIKPNTGTQGLGIKRLKLLNPSQCVLAEHHRQPRRMSIPHAIAAILRECRPHSTYIVQQGIDLATCQKRPFHFRVCLHKPVDSWQLSIVIGIMARQKNAVVTNESRGGIMKSVEEILYHHDEKWNPFHAFRELIDVSHQIAERIGSQLPLLVLGLDMAIDKKGRVWFIEANTRPDMSGLRNLTDRLSYQKYVLGKKRILKKLR